MLRNLIGAPEALSKAGNWCLGDPWSSSLGRVAERQRGRERFPMFLAVGTRKPIPSALRAATFPIGEGKGLPDKRQLIDFLNIRITEKAGVVGVSTAPALFSGSVKPGKEAQIPPIRKFRPHQNLFRKRCGLCFAGHSGRWDGRLSAAEAYAGKKRRVDGIPKFMAQIWRRENRFGCTAR